MSQERRKIQYESVKRRISLRSVVVEKRDGKRQSQAEGSKWSTKYLLSRACMVSEGTQKCWLGFQDFRCVIV